MDDDPFSYGYTYKPLDASKNEIRLLQLLPYYSRDSIVSARLFTCSLDENPVYSALSYTWGDASKTTPIYLENNMLLDKTQEQKSGKLLEKALQTGNYRVGFNLERALRYLRSDIDYVTLWVDAICINQADIAERNQQVSIMRDIYRRAKCVRSWVDIEVNGSDAAFRRLSNFAFEGNDDGTDLGSDPDFWYPVTKILCDNYWERLWIQQELIQAQEYWVHCREYIIPGSCLNKFTTLLNLKVTSGLGDAYNESSIDGITGWGRLFGSMKILGVPSKDLLMWRYWFLYHDRYYGQEPPRIHTQYSSIAAKLPKNTMHRGTLLNSLASFQELKVTDPKDRVIAVLGLAVDCQNGEIQVDYGQSLEKIYSMVPVFYTKRFRSLEFLCHVRFHTDPTPLRLSLPSWAPDWNSGVNMRLPYANHCASGTLLGIPNSIDESTEILKAQGIRIDRIQASFPKKDPKDQSVSSFISQIMQIYLAVARLEGEIDDIDISSDDEDAACSVPGVLWSTLANLAWQSSKTSTPDPILEKILRAISSEFGPMSKWETTKSTKFAALGLLFACSDPTQAGSVSMHDLMFYPLIQTAKAQLGPSFLTIYWTIQSYNILVTTKARVGLFPAASDVQENDQIWILFGCPLPIVLRPVEDKFRVICPAFLDDFMEGEVVRGISTEVVDETIIGEYQVRTIEIK